MAMLPNPYRSSIGGFSGYDNSGGNGDISQGISNLGTALFGDPKTMMTRDLYNSEIAKNNATTQGLNLDNDRKSRANTALSGIGALFTAKNADGTSRPATPDEIRGNIGTVMQTVLDAYSDPQKAADAVRLGAGLMGDPRFLSDTFVGAGGAYQNTPTGVEYVQGQENSRNKYSADSHAGAVLGAARIAEGGAMSRQKEKEEFGLVHPDPVKAAPGETVLFAPADVRAPSAGTTGIVPQGTAAPNQGTIYQTPQRPTSFDQMKATEAQKLLDSMPEGEAKDKLRRQLITPSTENAQLHANTQIELSDRRAVQAALQSAPKLTPSQTQALSPALDSILNDKGIALDPGARDQVTARAAQLYSTSDRGGVRGNLSGAMEQAITELQASGAKRTDYSLNPFSRPTYGLPDAAAPGQVAGTAAPAAVTAEQRRDAGGANAAQPQRGSMPPDGTVVHQGGNTYIIKNGQAVPAT